MRRKKNELLYVEIIFKSSVSIFENREDNIHLKQKESFYLELIF